MAAIFYKNLDILNYFIQEVYIDNDKMHDLFKMVDIDQKNIVHYAILSKDNQILRTVLDWLQPHRRTILSYLLRGADYKGNTGDLNIDRGHVEVKIGLKDGMSQKIVHAAWTKCV